MSVPYSPLPPNLPSLPLSSTLSLIDTPSAILNLSALKRNLLVMREWSTSSGGVAIRPHYKTHKCPYIAELQLRKKPTGDCDFEGGGATGICVQTLDELSSLCASIVSGWGKTWSPTNHGIVDIFLTNSITTPRKASRFLEIVLAAENKAYVSFAVDDVENLEMVKSVISSSPSPTLKVGVFVEVNVGQDRAGVTPKTQDGMGTILTLARSSPGPHTVYRGLHCYHGLLQHVGGYEDRRREV
eukprot:CAMPEP_0118648426 /NCGR_PEP_ID=MMETSP0785-20121206/9149_1 /TAXON_ID=91992 /ORGANISM="Bolidomonas pacifica, Strain CCMP 1866" /LENGTH=241 /DNA_ID=CAMNT_0006540617 /DNA_START=194 /DNA_END=915 /DNA_ORIENTATION=+